VLVGDRLINVKRGQMVMSFDYLAKRWNISKSTASAFIELLESDNMVERHTEQRKTILTICNYESYQQRLDDSPNIVPNNFRTTAEQLPNAFKEEKEIQEYNNNNSNACTREEKTSWNAQREQGFLNTFIGTGVGVTIARATGKSANEISILLEVFMAECQVKDNGHKDSNDFNTHFLNCIKGGFISLPAQPAGQPKKKVKSNAELLKEMHG
jgi:predicted transcriptional regulator